MLTLPFVNPYIRGDGNGYYAYVRSVVIDGDLRFENEYRRGDPAFVASVIGPDGRVSANLIAGNGYVRNQWAVGPSILWTPSFLLGHGFAWSLNAVGWPVPADGYSPPIVGSVPSPLRAYAFVGLALAWATAKQFVSPGIATAATMGIWSASPMPGTCTSFPFTSTRCPAFAVALLSGTGSELRQPHGRPVGSVGSVGWARGRGLLPQCGVPPGTGAELTREMLQRRERGAGSRVRSWREGSSWTRRGDGVAPALIIKWIIHGSPLRTGYEDHFFWASPRLWHVAFASEHGMFL